MPKITLLEAENFKRLRAVRITPDGSVVVLNGPNGSGKTSALDAIWAALGGKEASPDVPIRDGARKALARVSLDSGLVVERSWSASGTTKLTITGADGERLASPQTLLNELCSKHTIDPLAFASMDPRKQAATLKQIVGLDFAGHDARRKVLYDQRTEANRDAKRLEARLGGMPEHDPTAPEEEVSVGELITAHVEAQEAHTAHEARKRIVAETRMGNDNIAARIAKHQAELNRLEESLREREAWIETEVASLTEAEAELPNLEALNEQVSRVEDTNKAVRANAQRKTVEGEFRAANDHANLLTEQIEAIDSEKTQLLEAAQFPVEGLGFDEQGVIYNGLPFSQASHAERLRVSTAIGLALSPKLRVLLIRDAEKLDADGMRLITELAEEHDAQLWLERACHSDPGAVIIEDGAVQAG